MMTAFMALVAACAVAGFVLLAVHCAKLSAQLAAVARHVRLLTKRVERATGEPLPQLDARSLDVEPEPTPADLESYVPAFGPWEVPKRRNEMREDRAARMGA